MVACPSGLRSTPRKRVWGKLHRGFKSHRHRQFVEFKRLDNEFVRRIQDRQSAVLLADHAFGTDG